MAFWDLRLDRMDRPALILQDGGIVTYGMLSYAAGNWARRLRDAASGRNPLLALEFVTTADAIAAYIGALRAGLPLLVVAPGQLDPWQPLRSVWRPDLMIRPSGEVRSEVACRLAEPPGMQLAVRDGWQADTWPDPHPDLALLLSTSGSTGEPKLVRLSAENIASNASAIAEYLQLVADDRAVTTLPLFYSYGISVLNSYLAVGATLVLSNASVTEPAFFDTARAAGATSLALVPHQFDLLARSGFQGSEIPTLRYVTQAGGRLPPSMVEDFVKLGRAAGWQLFVMYGQTEAAPRISYVPPDALPGAAGTIGRAIPGGRLWLRDETGQEIVRTGQPGELVYQGPNVMMGYGTCRADLARGREIDSLATGDIAERTCDGFFRITGRMKRFVKVFGLRLSLDQIEALLHSHGIAAQAVAVGDDLVLMHREPGEGSAARRIVSTEYNLPEAAVHVGHLADIPVLASGKPDHRAIRSLAAEVLSRSAEATRAARKQESLADILGHATRRQDVGPQDSFTALGGDSLSYIQVQMALEERFGQAPAGWENMTLTALESLTPATSVSGQRRLMRVPIDIVLRLVAIALVVAQHASNYSLYGGTWVLILLIGVSVGRFQMRQIARGRPMAFLLRMLYPLVPFYFLLLLLYQTLRDTVPVTYWFLVGNYIKWTEGSLLNVYWFVNLYAQIILFVTVVIAVPWLRRVVSAHPWGAAAVAQTGLLVLLVAISLLYHRPEQLPYYPQRGLIECLGVFVLGWMIIHQRGRAEHLFTVGFCAATLAILMHLDMTLRVVLLLAAAIVLVWSNLTIPMPRRLGIWLNRLASATLFIYLLHQIVITGLATLHLPPVPTALLALILSSLAALAAQHVFGAVEQVAFQWWRSCRDAESAAQQNATEPVKVARRNKNDA